MNEDNNVRHRRLLVIDDNRSIHQDFSKIFAAPSASDTALTEAGAALFGDPLDQAARIEFQIDSAFQGQEGLARVRQAREEDCPYALAFVDGRMPPGWDGIETTAKIWEHDPEIQVVICTAYSDYSWSDMVAKLPKPDQLLILKKPFDAVEVLQLAHALTEKWQLQKAVQFRLQHMELHVAARTRVIEQENAKLKAEVTRITDALRRCEARLHQAATTTSPPA
jgi:two-component system NtrC family sensor kinase